MIIKDLKELANKVFNGKECQSIKYIDGNRQEHEIWSNGEVYYLGLGTSFDVKNIYENYDELTVNDFFITPREGTLISTSYTCRTKVNPCDDGCNDFSDRATFSKSYNASTGIFSCSYAGSVYVWLIPNSNKLIEKGKIKALPTITSATSTNVSSLEPKYRQLTKNNFLVRTLPNQTSAYICCSWNCPNSVGFGKSYNQSTGVFSGGSSAGRGHYDDFPQNRPQNVNWFLISPSLIKQ